MRLLVPLLFVVGCVAWGWDTPHDDPEPTTPPLGDDDSSPATDDDSSPADDDSVGGDDDDTSVSDDDSEPGDDDTTGSDDDTAPGDDDTSVGDDDDVTGTGDAVITATPSALDFGSVTPGQPPGELTVDIYNSGANSAICSIFLTNASGGVFTIAPSEPTVFVGGGQTVTYSVFFSPVQFQAYGTDFELTHDGTNPSPIVLHFVGQGGVPESSCDDGLDNDGDLDVDCADSDCFGNPACNAQDFCCFTGDGLTSGSCQNTAARDCACAIDAWCCGSGWDSTCIGFYTNDCGAQCTP